MEAFPIKDPERIRWSLLLLFQISTQCYFYSTFYHKNRLYVLHRGRTPESEPPGKARKNLEQDQKHLLWTVPTFGLMISISPDLG